MLALILNLDDSFKFLFFMNFIYSFLMTFIRYKFESLYDFICTRLRFLYGSLLLFENLFYENIFISRK